ncbi:hypothetical protein XELAEV_18045266mg [Xenopus laevis]|uniref:Uncharacterized protein n=1 Tax=Xenopus laevis TaxID=8355 RepID=A0A974C0E3_XENLA|nr:hypothetical protein XELAEV_18045266mg [Xenopus laevis]
MVRRYLACRCLTWCGSEKTLWSRFTKERTTAGRVLQPSQLTKLQSMFSLTHQSPYQSIIESIHIIHQGELCTGIFPLKSSNKN